MVIGERLLNTESGRLIYRNLVSTMLGSVV